MIACERIRQEFVKTGKYQNWRTHPLPQDFETQSETALDVKELFDSRLPKVINKVHILNLTLSEASNQDDNIFLETSHSAISIPGSMEKTTF